MGEQLARRVDDGKFGTRAQSRVNAKDDFALERRCHEDGAQILGEDANGHLLRLGSQLSAYLAGDGLEDGRHEERELVREAEIEGEVVEADDDLVQAIVEAPLTRPDRFTVLEHLALAPAQVPDLLAAYNESVTG